MCCLNAAINCLNVVSLADVDDDELPILPCAEKLELVLSTAPRT